MDNEDFIKNELEPVLEEIKQEIEIIKSKMSELFNINEVVTSDTGGKTKLNRQFFNEVDEYILQQISVLEKQIQSALSVVRNSIKDLLEKNNQYVKQDLIHMVFDDKNFLDLLGVDLDNHGVTKSKQKFLLKQVEKFLGIKNSIFNLQYYTRAFNPTNFDLYINRLGLEDLLNSSVIFEIINSYGLLFEQLTKLKYELETFSDEKIEKISSFQFLNSVLELYKRRTDHFYYAGVKYKIFLEYNNDLFFSKSLKINKAYVENIVANLIEQSCMDLIKKELKKGKVQKLIEIEVKKVRRSIVISVKNNGFEIKNKYNLFISELDNQFMIDAQNLSREIGAKLEVNILENEGMQYEVIL